MMKEVEKFKERRRRKKKNRQRKKRSYNKTFQRTSNTELSDTDGVTQVR